MELQKNSIIIKDFVSSLSHFIGFIAAFIASPFLIGHMIVKNASLSVIIGCIIYCLSMILLYLASSTYHFFYDSTNTLKKLDHMMIFALIAGSYTPVCISLLGYNGRILLAIIWILAIIGMILMLYFVTCPKWISSIIYILMGWSCIFVIPDIVQATSTLGITLLAIGGVMYTIGGVIYALKLKIFNARHQHFSSHDIFHIFVLIGSFFHYIFMYFCLIH